MATRRTSTPATGTPKSYGEAAKVQGLASYFPSIERSYGHPVEHWFEVLNESGERKHMEYVSLLKSAHGIGHGHANALVAHWLAGKTR